MSWRLMIPVMVLAALPWSASGGTPEIPKSWTKTMTNDPSTNYFLARITSPLGNKDAELVRAVLVSVLALRGCDGVALNDKAAQHFLAENGYYALTGKRWSDAEFQARNSLGGPTDREIAHLCSGVDYLFGDNGVMGPGLLNIGVAKPNHYDPANPYFQLPKLPEPSR